MKKMMTIKKQKIRRNKLIVINNLKKQCETRKRKKEIKRKVSKRNQKK